MATRPAFPIRKSPADIVRDTAPDLLAALINVENALQDHEKKWPKTLRVVRAAIAKARGQV